METENKFDNNNKNDSTETNVKKEKLRSIDEMSDAERREIVESKNWPTEMQGPYGKINKWRRW